MDEWFFIVSKLFWNLFNPVQLLFVLLAAGVVLCFTRWRRMGFKLALLSGLSLFLLGSFPVGKWIAFPLEQRFSLDELPNKIEGIILLGGARLRNKQFVGDRAIMHEDLRRYSEGLVLMRHYPDVPVIFTGLGNKLFPNDLSEADIARQFFEMEGETQRVVYEKRARNTYENAVYSKAFAQGRLHQPWLLITSAVHMPRSVGVFRAAGWNVIPAPVGYTADKNLKFLPQKLSWEFSLDRLLQFNDGIKQWLGLLAYYLTGKTDDFFPA